MKARLLSLVVAVAFLAPASPGRAAARLRPAVRGVAEAGLIRGNHPKVEEGNEAFSKGDYEGALKHYEEAQKELPRSAELQFNLGNAYLKLNRPDDARRAYEQALNAKDDSLKARDYYNLGNAMVQLNKHEDAIAAYRQALKIDPSFEPARHNLSVMLMKPKPPNQKQSAGDGGSSDGGGGDGGRDGGGADGGSKDGGGDGGGQQGDGGGSDAAQASDGGGDGGAGDGGSKGDGGGGGDGGGEKSDGGGGGDGGEQQQSDGGEEQQDGGETQDGGQGQSKPDQKEQEKPKDVDKQRAEQLLDSIRRNEKQFLMNQKTKRKQRAPEKDW